MTVKTYLLSLRDSDAEALAVSLEKDLANLSIDTPCGADCKRYIDQTRDYVAKADAHGVSEEFRWGQWYDCSVECNVAYFG